jgi:hypothetical protein
LGCVSFITIARMEGDFIDLKWMKKVEDFRRCWLFIDILEESELFLITGVPPRQAHHLGQRGTPRRSLEDTPPTDP